MGAAWLLVGALVANTGMAPWAAEQRLDEEEGPRTVPVVQRVLGGALLTGGAAALVVTGALATAAAVGSVVVLGTRPQAPAADGLRWNDPVLLVGAVPLALAGVVASGSLLVTGGLVFADALGPLSDIHGTQERARQVRLRKAEQQARSKGTAPANR
jgi:hypothetical protein